MPRRDSDRDLEEDAAGGWTPREGGPALDSSGELSGTSQSPRPRDHASEPDAGLAPPGEFARHQGPLELSRELRREEVPPEIGVVTHPEPGARRRGWGRALAWLLALAALALGLAAAWPELTRRLARALPRGEVQVLSITSEPDGATVLIDGREVGTTPLFIENGWQGPAVRVELRLRGYEPWTGTFAGGQRAFINASLKSRRRDKRP